MIISLMKNKEKISKTAGGGEELHIEDIIIDISDILQFLGQRKIFKGKKVKIKICPSRIRYPVKLYFKNEGEIKTFLNK